MTHIVICGYPRSGSTLLYNMLRATVLSYLFFDREVPALKALGASPRITKNPNDVFEAVEIARRAGARFIVTLRDPRAVLVSRHAHGGGGYKINWDFGLKTAHRRGVVGTNQGLIERHLALAQVPDPVRVKYEDLVSDPGGTQERLQGAFGFRYAGRFADFHKADIPPLLGHQLNGVRPPETSRIASWRRHPERIRAQFTACTKLFDLLIEHGYEEDRKWFDDL